MDRVIELVIVFYLISAFLRFLKKSQQGKDRHYPPPQRQRLPQQRGPSPPSPHREPGPSSSTSRPKEAAPRPVLTPREREALDVLADWERRARTHREGPTGPAAPSPGRASTPPGRTAEIPPGRGPVPEMRTRPTPAEIISCKAAGEAISAGQGAVPGELQPPLSGRPEISGEKIDAEGISFLIHPDMLWQGVVMSEILRPPLAMRKPFQLPSLLSEHHG
ncbi:MAG: hypothetical protein AB1611_09300 [bacterium]